MVTMRAEINVTD